MRLIGSFVAIVLLLLALVMGWQLLGLGKSSSLSIAQPTAGATLSGASVPVAVSADAETMAQLATTNVSNGKDGVMVVYLDGNEVQRTKALNFNLLNVPSGDHSLQVRLYQSQGNTFDLSKQSNIVSFRSTGVTNAATDPNYGSVPGNLYGAGANNGNVAAQVATTPTPLPTAQPTQAAPQSAPNTGMGGMANVPQNVAALPGQASNDSIYGGPIVAQAAPTSAPVIVVQSEQVAQPQTQSVLPADPNNNFLMFAALYLVVALVGAFAIGLGTRALRTRTPGGFTDRWTALRQARRGMNTVEDQVAPTRVNVMRRLTRDF